MKNVMEDTEIRTYIEEIKRNIEDRENWREKSISI